MKTITEFVRSGINDPSELKEALQTAMRLEFSTLPPYLCAEWSIIDGQDPNGVADKIHGIVLQEMFHFALAGNILSAIGGAFKLTSPDFLPNYPTDTLPGDIHQDLIVDLKPLSKDQLQVFMQIETPEFPPVEIEALAAPGPATIGEFYTTLSDAIQTLNPPIDQNAHFVKKGKEVFQIASIQDARDAIERIKSEGEGAPGQPDQPANPAQLAHFYIFKEIFVGNELAFDPNTGKLVPVAGKTIQLPGVSDFKPSNANPNPSIAFNRLLAQLLSDLEACWTQGANLGQAIGDMDSLADEGRNLISRHIRPEFAAAATQA